MARGLTWAGFTLRHADSHRSPSSVSLAVPCRFLFSLELAVPANALLRGSGYAGRSQKVPAAFHESSQCSGILPISFLSRRAGLIGAAGPPGRAPRLPAAGMTQNDRHGGSRIAATAARSRPGWVARAISRVPAARYFIKAWIEPNHATVGTSPGAPACGLRRPVGAVRTRSDARARASRWLPVSPGRATPPSGRRNAV